MVLIVKRKGHKESFDEKKAYASCYFAARNCHLSEQESEKIAATALKNLKMWVSAKKEVSSSEIFEFLSNELSKIRNDVGFMYKTHMDIN